VSVSAASCIVTDKPPCSAHPSLVSSPTSSTPKKLSTDTPAERNCSSGLGKDNEIPQILNLAKPEGASEGIGIKDKGRPCPKMLHRSSEHTCRGEF